jgi:hypothetical protein
MALLFVWRLANSLLYHPFSVLTGGRAYRLPNIIMVIIFNP